MIDDRDAAFRFRAFHFLTDQRRRFGEASIPRSVLERGFDFGGVRVPLIGPQGIFKPAILPKLPLPITTAPPVEHRERPYDDGFIDNGFLHYRYRGTDPSHRDNVGLRTAMQRQTPLIYLHGIVQGLYEAAWPVFIVEDHPETLSFVVAIDDQIGAPAAWQFNDPAALTARRQYVTAVVRQRCTSGVFASACSAPIRSAAPSAGSAMMSCWKPPTSSPTAIPWGSRSFPTVSRSASSTTPPSTATSSASRPTSRSPCVSTCWKKSTGRCSSMASRAFKACASTCRAPTTSSPIATSWPSATPSSAARAELYPSGHVDTKIPRCVEWRHGVATSRAQARSPAPSPR